MEIMIMFCVQCGNPVDKHDKYCSICGAKQIPVNEPASNNSSPIPPKQSASCVQPSNYTQPSGYTQIINVTQPEGTNAICVIGFVLSIINLLFSLGGVIALIVSIVGLCQCNRRREKGKGFAIAGILIAAIPFLLGFIYGFVYGITTYSG